MEQLVCRRLARGTGHAGAAGNARCCSRRWPLVLVVRWRRPRRLEQARPRRERSLQLGLVLPLAALGRAQLGALPRGAISARRAMQLRRTNTRRAACTPGPAPGWCVFATSISCRGISAASRSRSTTFRLPRLIQPPSALASRRCSTSYNVTRRMTPEVDRRLRRARARAHRATSAANLPLRTAGAGGHDVVHAAHGVAARFRPPLAVRAGSGRTTSAVSA